MSKLIVLKWVLKHNVMSWIEIKYKVTSDVIYSPHVFGRLYGPGIESLWGEILRCRDWPWCLTSLLYNGYRVFPGGKVRLGLAADHSPPYNAADIFWSALTVYAAFLDQCTDSAAYRWNIWEGTIFLFSKTSTTNKGPTQLSVGVGTGASSPG
jgi:hypothetical protein